MAVDVTKITHGPAKVEFGSTELSHTQGGVTVTVAPQQRMRTVDRYGNSPIDVIHQGDEVRVAAPLAEWTAAVLAAIYDPGNDQTGGSAGSQYIGVGRKAGYVYAKAALDVTPLVTAHAEMYCEIPKAVPVGQLELLHNTDDDRVFNFECVACVDPAATDGELIGKIWLDSAA